jgi:hypothetical protein
VVRQAPAASGRTTAIAATHARRASRDGEGTESKPTTDFYQTKDETRPAPERFNASWRRAETARRRPPSSGVQARLVPAPRSTLEWGGPSVMLGFVLLLACLGTHF